MDADADGITQNSPNGSASAVNLSGTGLDVVVPSHASHPSHAENPAYTRRRPSWSNAGSTQDSPWHDRPAFIEPGPSNVAILLEDPFLSSTDRPSRMNPYNFRSHESSTSLLSSDSETDTAQDDDATRLTEDSGHSRWSPDLSSDSERSVGVTTQPRRQYVTSSHRRIESTIKNAFRRASVRVANVWGHEPPNQLQEEYENSGSGSKNNTVAEETTQGGVAERISYQPRPSIPLRGRPLGLLGPTNALRVWLYKLLIHPCTEPTILALIILNTVALVVQASHTLLLSSTQVPVTVTGYFHAWEDFVLFVLFALFTVEALARICISGLLLDPEVPTSALFSLSFSKLTRAMSTNSAANNNVDAPIKRSGSLVRGLTLKRMYNRLKKPFALSSNPRTPLFAQVSPDIPLSSSTPHHDNRNPELPATFLSRAMKSDVLKSDPNALVSLPFRLNIDMAQSKIARNIPYLRQSWGRVDFIAVIGFWASFALATMGLERGTYHIGVFRALSVLRTARLLNITNGTAAIMHSLKISRSLLANVVYFIIFAMMLFSMIGVQSFKGSLRRNCNILPVLGENATQLPQFCGGHINATTLAPSPYVQFDGNLASITKGFICPLGQVCQEGQNPYSGVESFDTIYYAILQIVILASANTWSQVMYQIIASEFAASSIFFISGILVLNFWLLNLLVAVITNTFAAIRAGTKRSAFGAAPLGHVTEEPEEGWPVAGRHNRLKMWWSYTRWVWVLLALASLVVQATITTDMSATHREIIDITERIITFAFDIEIVVRIGVELPAWRNFFRYGDNWLDLILAIGCSIIQIPVIHSSSVYGWLTIFQLARFYRVILVVPRMKPLMLTTFGNMYGLVHMTLFLMLINFLAALVGIQLVRGDMSATLTMNFGQLFNSFLAVYQIFSTENWTTVMYNATEAELSLGQAVIVATFLSCWLLFANFIVMQMFIAVINENFSVAEEAKRGLQESNYSRQLHGHTSSQWIGMLNPYRWLTATSTVKDNSSSNVVLREEALMQRGPIPTHRMTDQRRALPSASSRSRHLHQQSVTLLHELFTGDETRDNVPLLDMHRERSESRRPEVIVEHETDRYFDILARLNKDSSISKDATDTHRTRAADLIRMHPTYDKSFWIFPQTNYLRHICQKVVRPSGGERIFGTPPSNSAHSFFQLAILIAVLGNLVTEAIATPHYRRNYYMQHGPTRGAWFNITEATFGLILVVEFLVKTIADGFLFAPNAYIRSIWNILDLVIMIGFLANVTCTLIFVSGLSRFVLALKALQALRFITLFGEMRSTFENLILAGFTRILEAAVFALLYLIPFSVWGTTIFAGLMNECNDTSVQGMGDCTNEYVNTIYGNKFGFPVPRAWDNPAPSTKFSFDNFRASVLILFEIVSLEGWIDVMSVAMSITGLGQQPRTNASQANAVFFVIYNLLGGVVILTLFVSIIIGNFSSRTGSALLTQPQREWIDLQKLIKRLKPSKRPKVRPTSLIRAWSYDRAIHKHGWWSRMMTFFFLLQMVVMMTEAFSAQTIDDWQDGFSMFLTLLYVMDTTIRLYGLGWHSFRANGWNLFDVIVAFGSFTTTLIAHFYSDDFTIQLLQKLFLISITFKLVQRVDSLNQLFKTGTSSLPVILHLLGLWFTFFLFFAIMYMEVFGLTKWGSGENAYQNYQTMGFSILMLAFMSTGEGWNQFMHDYTLSYPRCTQVSYGVYQTDCGSAAWAYSMFIAWNLLSMYIFVNMFTGVVVQNFSYVFQSTGGILRSITRQEIRAFKKAWAEFSDPNSGLLERPNLAPFLAKLGGVFEVRIYPTRYSRASILAACQDKSKRGDETGGINMRKLNKFLNEIDYGAIRKRREVYMRIYHEANVIYYRGKGKGISFREMLELLAHHKLIDDQEALGLKELEVREETIKLVSDLVRVDMVLSRLGAISCRRQFLQERDEMRAATRGIPTIVDSTLPVTPPRVGRASDARTLSVDMGEIQV